MASVSELSALIAQADALELEKLQQQLAKDSRAGIVAALQRAHRRIQRERAEIARVELLYTYERDVLDQHDVCVAVGLDEVGRGAIAGPLAVGAVVLDSTAPAIALLNDSKQLKPDVRVRVAQDIKDACLAWTVVYIAPDVIDAQGMTASLRQAFSEAVAHIERAGVALDAILLDGNPLRFDVREINVVKGDATCASIAAASVVAKVERDAVMTQLDAQFPGYGFAIHKGYGTDAHTRAIREQGLSTMHRKTFCTKFLQPTLF